MFAPSQLNEINDGISDLSTGRRRGGIFSLIRFRLLKKSLICGTPGPRRVFNVPQACLGTVWGNAEEAGNNLLHTSRYFDPDRVSVPLTC